jgi:hypothetical protein
LSPEGNNIEIIFENEYYSDITLTRWKTNFSFFGLLGLRVSSMERTKSLKLYVTRSTAW